jgi:hypothetical protein
MINGFFQVGAMKIGSVSACVVLNTRRERRDGAETAETNDFSWNAETATELKMNVLHVEYGSEGSF